MGTNETVSDSVERMLSVIVHIGRTRPMRDPLASMSELDMSPPTLHTIMWLGLDGHLPMSTLAERVGISLPNCTRTVDRLKEGGYLLRERDHADRRRVQVRLSAKGQRVWDKMQSAMRQKMEAMLSGFTPDERAQFVDLLERLGRRITESDPPEIGAPSSRRAS